MLAGVGGIDAALLVIAADEGPMPQTAEHLAILDLLEVEHGLVVLSKRDLVDDEWLELVSEETRERLAGTTLDGAPLVPVSATTGAGLDMLRDALAALLAALPEHAEVGRPRLPIDRAFSVAGFGTVVTGTLLDGALEVGQEVELLPHGTRGRVRGLQSHGRKVERGLPGARTAVNLSGVDREALRRGDVLTTPGWLRPTTLLDARLRMVAGAPAALEQNDPVDLFIGAAEAQGHVTLLGADRLPPGADGWVQIRLAQPVVATAGDRFIIRQPSPSLTIGGGRVVDPHPRRHRRFRPEVIIALETRATGTPSERLLQLLAAGPAELRAVGEQLGLDTSQARELAGEAIAGGEVVALGATASGALAPNRLIARRAWLAETSAAVTRLLGEFHARQPLRRGMAREEVKSRLELGQRVFDALLATLVAEVSIVDHGSLLALAGHAIRLTPAQQAAAGRYVAALAGAPNAPPAPDGFGIGPDLLAAMAELGQIVRLPDNIVFGAEQLASIQRETLAIIDAEGSITLAQFRDHFGSSRKYAQAVLEYFDQQRVTRRVGDARVRGARDA
jgi:selenocysteine-specific elongation factor